MFQGNPAHTGYVPGTFDLSSFALRWETNIEGGLSLNPVTAGEGEVFVSQLDYFGSAGLYALDAANGNLLWSVAYGNVFSVNPPSYSPGKVFIQTGKHTFAEDTALHAYNATNGTLLFQSPFNAQWERYYAPTIYAGKVYVDGGYYGGMYSFDGKSGTQLWFAALNQYDQWTPAVDAKYAYAYTGEDSPNLSIIDRRTGALAFNIPDPQFEWNGWSMDLAPVVGSANDVLAIHDGRLICFDIAATNISWQLQDNFQGQPSVAKRVIYAINAGTINARDELTGALLWSWEAPDGALMGTMIVSDSHLLAGTATRIYAVNLQTHLSEWSYLVSGCLALSEGVLYVAGTDGTLTAITAPASYSLTNQPPICVIGGPYQAECNGTATAVQLDGSGSYDPDDLWGGSLTYSWSSDCTGSLFDDSTSPTPTLTMTCFGTQACTVRLVLSDGELVSSNQTTVTVVDTLAPSLAQLAAKPATLWPPSHRLVPVTIRGAVSDTCDPVPTWRIISISSSDPVTKPPAPWPVGPSYPEMPPAAGKIPGSSSNSDFKITGARTVLLRADSNNPRVGRTYKITIRGKDAAGNIATRMLVVKVPASAR